MKTKVFCYKGYLGISSGISTEGLINDPLDDGQIGFVLDANKVLFSEEAVSFLQQIEKSSDDVGDVDCFRSVDGMVVFSWIGGPKRLICTPNEVSGSNKSDFSLLVSTSGIVPDVDFINHVDNHIIK